MRRFFLALTLALQPALALADGDVELVENMSQLQYFAHKASLSIEHKNQELLDFYAHELEEYLEETAGVESYDGFPVGKLVESMLMPAFKKFEDAAKKGKWEDISRSFDKVISACNNCHQATEHGFIKIERSSKNPYMQNFKP